MPRPMGTASTRAMAVVSMVPRMKAAGRSGAPGAQTCWKMNEKPRAENAGRECQTIVPRNQMTMPANSAAAMASIAL